jgi:hypothetical protein
MADQGLSAVAGLAPWDIIDEAEGRPQRLLVCKMIANGSALGRPRVKRRSRHGFAARDDENYLSLTDLDNLSDVLRHERHRPKITPGSHSVRMGT